MKTVIIKKKGEEKKKCNLPDDYYEQQNHQMYINMLILNQKYVYDNEIKKEIQAKIRGYIQQDKKKDRIGDYINLEDTIEKIVTSKLECKYCLCKLKLVFKEKRDEEQWTLDRIDNDLPHTKNNVLVCCLKCNIKRGRMNKDKYEFTKKLNIVKI